MFVITMFLICSASKKHRELAPPITGYSTGIDSGEGSEEGSGELAPPSSRAKASWRPGLIDSVTQIQGLELDHPNIYLTCELLELM